MEKAHVGKLITLMCVRKNIYFVFVLNLYTMWDRIKYGEVKCCQTKLTRRKKKSIPINLHK